MRQFYKTLKAENPDAVLIGEVWEDASNKVSYSEQREYLSGYDIDSAMNYAQRALMVDFVTGAKEARRMNDELTRLREITRRKIFMLCSTSSAATTSNGS